MLVMDKSPNARKADFVRIPDAAGFTPSGDFTLECCGVRFTTTTGTQALYSHYNASGNQRSLLFQWVSGTGLQGIVNSDGATNTTLTYSWTPTTGVAYQLCFERSGTTLRLYVDGVVVATGTKAGGLFNSTDPVYVGCANTGTPPNNLFSGSTLALRLTMAARYAGAYTPPSLPLPAA